jgi:hypothetical protein
MLIASVAPLVLPYTLVFVSIGLQLILILIQTILAAMLNQGLVIMCMASVLVGASAGAGYVIASHKITELNMSEAERLQKEQEAATDLDDDDYDDEDEDDDDEDDEDDDEKSSVPNEEVLEPAPKMLRIKTPPIPLTELSTPSSDVMPKAPIALPEQEETAQPPVMKADLTVETPPAI